MRKKELINLIKQDMTEVMPDFGAMLDRINTVEVERERYAVPETATKANNKSDKTARTRVRGERSAAIVEKRNKAIGIAGLCLALVMVVVSMFSMNFGGIPLPPALADSADNYVTININPAIDFTVNKNNKITSAKATNASGVVLMAKMTDKLGTDSLVGYEINGALIDTVDMAVQMGYIDVDAEGLSNALMISVLGKDESSAEEIKNGLAKETKKYFADNGIYAVVITDYDSKEALVEEAKKNNPNLNENSSVGELIASVVNENAGKSVIEAEIEEARKDYETYLSEQFESNINSTINSEISKISDTLKRTEKILSVLEEIKDLYDNGVELADKIGAVESDAFLEALAEEYALKTSKYIEYKANYDSQIEKLNIAIKNTEDKIKANNISYDEAQERFIINLDATSDKRNKLQALEDERLKLELLTTELKNNLTAAIELTELLSDFRNTIENQTVWMKRWSNCSCNLCIAKTNTVNRIVSEGLFYEIIRNGTTVSPLSTGDEESVLFIKQFTAVTLSILAETLNVSEDKIDAAWVNEIVDEYIAICYNYIDKTSYFTAVDYMLNANNPGRVGSYGEITNEIVQANYQSELDKLLEIRDNYYTQSNVLVALNGRIGELEIEINNLYAEHDKIMLEISELDSTIKSQTQELSAYQNQKNDLNAEFNAENSSYGKFLTSIIDKVKARIEETNNVIEQVRNFKNSYEFGKRLDGFDELNTELKKLEEKFIADKAANDAEAVAKTVEENIKASADRRYSENVAKYEEHDRTFTEEEYAAWEAEQEALIAGIDWNKFYEQWLSENE